MSIIPPSRFDGSQFHPPSQPMNLNSSLIQLGLATNRVGSEALKRFATNEEAFCNRQLFGGTNGMEKPWPNEARSCYDWCCDCFPKQVPIEGQIVNPELAHPVALQLEQVEGNGSTI